MLVCSFLPSRLADAFNFTSTELFAALFNALRFLVAVSSVINGCSCRSIFGKRSIHPSCSIMDSSFSLQTYSAVESLSDQAFGIALVLRIGAETPDTRKAARGRGTENARITGAMHELRQLRCLNAGARRSPSRVGCHSEIEAQTH